MGASALTLLALALLLSSAAAAPKRDDDQLPSWYRCSCPGSGAAPGCVCPSAAPPGGLAPEDAPQFVLFTHDDAVTEATYDAFVTVLGGRASATGGCKPAATLFTLARGTNCTVLQQLYDEGYEVASHSLTHQKMNGWGREEVDAEVAGGRASLASKCGMPEGSIRGFRQPFLQASATVREVLAAAGFQYDSSLIEDPEGQSLSRGMAARLWPYSLQDGIPQNCEEWEPFQTCDREERYPSLFEVPVWDMQSVGLFSEDPKARQGRSVYQTLVRIFDAAYNGNRAPVPLYVHGGWLQENQADVARFVDYALAKPGTFFVTVQQLLAWLQNLQPAAQLTAANLGCGSPGGVPGPVEGTAAGSSSGGSASSDGGAEGSSKGGSPASATPAAAPDAAAAAATPAVARNLGQQQEQQQEPAEALPAQPAAGDDVQQQGGAAAAAATAEVPASAQAATNGGTSSSSSGSSSSNLPAIIGGAIGGAVAAVAALALGAVLTQRRRQRRAAAEEAAAALSSNGGWTNRQSAYASHLVAGATADVAAGEAADGCKAAAIHPRRDRFELTEVVEQSGTPSSARRRVKTPFQH